MRYLLGATALKVARHQDRMQRVLGKQYSRAIAAEIARAMQAMAAGLAVNNEPGDVPLDHYSRLQAIYGEMAEASIRMSGDAVLSQSKALAGGYERKSFAEFFQRLTRQFIVGEAVRQRITGIVRTTRRQVIRIVKRGQERGHTFETIAKTIDKTAPRIGRRRAVIIARTEIHAASNFAGHEAAKATGLNLRKEWVSVRDTRIRDFNEPTLAEYDHRKMDGVIVEMDQPYMVPRINGTFEPIMYPGDPSGKPGNVINCRCQSVQIVVE